ncbi:hypothetical protein BH11ARM1_BH11ARM1_10300 [soil metagenome]
MLVFSLGFALAAITAQGPVNPPPHMTVTYGGNPAGESTYKANPDGTFVASISMTLGPTKLTENITGKFENNKLTSLLGNLDRGTGAGTLKFEDGKWLATPPKGKEIEIPGVKDVSVYCGNLLPQFNYSLFKAVDFTKKQTQTVEALMVDGPTVLDVKVLPKEERKTPGGMARFYHVEFASVGVEYVTDESGEVVGMDVPSQKLRLVADGWDGLFIDPFAKYPELSPAKSQPLPPTTQKMMTRDGVELVQTVILPAGGGKFPVVFERTPYNRKSASVGADSYVRRGYAYVCQDVRGRTDSSGEWVPFVNEMNDGYDTLDWISKQPWCDGNVGMIGASYDGFVQWAAAASLHPALKCIIPQVSPPMDAMSNLPYEGGMFFLYGDVWWAKIVSGKSTDMSTVQASLPNPKGFLTLPLSKVDDAVLGHDVPFFNKWLTQTTSKDWNGFYFYDQAKKITIPALHISGWWDGDEIGTNKNWEAMRANGLKNQWLIYGPWTHFFNTTSKLGDVDYGDTAIIDLDTLYIRWFDTYLKHKDVGMGKIPHVQAFITGANKWVTGTDWPLPASKSKSLYFSAQTSANGLKSKGLLVDAPAASQKPSVYTYDPAKAIIPSLYFNVDPSKASTKIGKDDDSKDSWVFRTEAMKQATTITGPFDVELQFSTSAKDTDFIVGFADEDEKGVMHVIGQGGKIRASYLSGFDKVRPLTPGKIYTAHLKPWDFAHQFAKGHKVVVQISSNAFPQFARNLGTAEPIATATKMVAQKNSLFHDKIHPSKITFRVVSGL